MCVCARSHLCVCVPCVFSFFFLYICLVCFILVCLFTYLSSKKGERKDTSRIVGRIWEEMG